MQGRKPMATEVRKVAGSPRSNQPSRANANEPKPPLGKPKPGQTLRGDKLARAKHKQVVGWLEDLNLATEVDSDLVDRYSNLWAAYADAVADVKRNGAVIVNPKTEMPMSNPAVTNLIKIDNQLHKISADFGFGASNRARLNAHPDSSETDPFLEFLERQKSISN
jgi:P27 family predicted phage terminase small subunit